MAAAPCFGKIYFSSMLFKLHVVAARLGHVALAAEFSKKIQALAEVAFASSAVARSCLF